MNLPKLVVTGPEAPARIVPQAFDKEDLRYVAKAVMSDNFRMSCYHEPNPFCLDVCFNKRIDPANGIYGIGGHKIAECLNECCW